MPRGEVKSHVPVHRASRRCFDYDASVVRFGSILLLGFAACASSVPRTVPRVVDGRVEEGPAVAPYAYEWFIEGEIQAVQGRHDTAAIAFENAAAAPAGDVVLITRLAEEYEMSGAVRRADRMMSLARRHYPSSARVALTEGRIAQHRGEVDAASHELLEAKTRHVLESLPDRYRVALLWRYWEKRSAQEMAMQTGKTTKAIERLLARARQQFRRRWEDE